MVKVWEEYSRIKCGTYIVLGGETDWLRNGLKEKKTLKCDRVNEMQGVRRPYDSTLEVREEMQSIAILSCGRKCVASNQ